MLLGHNNFSQKNIKLVFTAFTSNVNAPEKVQREGVKLITIEDIRWLSCDIKSLNLSPNILAKQEVIDKGCFEAILHHNDTVTETS